MRFAINVADTNMKSIQRSNPGVRVSKVSVNNPGEPHFLCFFIGFPYKETIVKFDYKRVELWVSMFFLIKIHSNEKK